MENNLLENGWFILFGAISVFCAFKASILYGKIVLLFERKDKVIFSHIHEMAAIVENKHLPNDLKIFNLEKILSELKKYD